MRDGVRTVRSRDTELWPAIPPRVADQIRPLVPALAEKMIAEISSSVAEYARLGDPAYARNLRLGAHEAVTGFADRIAWPRAPRQRMADVFYMIGKAEAAEGRSLEMLEAALRAGARVVMHGLTSAAQQAIIPAEMVGLLAEALLIHIDEIATLSAAGYERVQARTAEETTRRRHRLLTLLLAEPAPADAIAAQASLAHWRLPALLSVVVLNGHDGLPGRFPALPGEVLVDLDRPQPCVIVPDPSGPGRRQMLDRALAGCRAAVGPPVPVSGAVTSLHWAAETLALISGPTAPGNRVVYCDDYLTEMVLHRGEDVLGRLTVLRLAPLSHVAMPRRKALAETLLAWLQTRSIGQTAARLHIHPQTARYRMNQIRRMFGPALDDPDTRFELEMALRARRILRATG